jgi:hypothetical protein
MTKLRSSKQQVGGMTLEQCFHLNILLLSMDRAAFFNYEQITIHICPRIAFALFKIKQ